MKYFIGIDLGTSAVKLLLVDENGKIINSVSKKYPLNMPKNGWFEQNPEDWLSAVCQGIKELTASIDPKSVRALGVAGQMHGLVMLDENDKVLRPAILWNDTRTKKETQFLNNVIGRDRLVELTGNIAFAGFTAPKILWVKENEPEIFEKCAKICLPKDYINYMLTGVFATDVSDASGTLYFDVENREWSRAMLDILGIEEKMLPEIYESFHVIGRTKMLGLDCKVIAGAGDNAAAATGTGTVDEGQCNISLGTSGTVFIPTQNFHLPENNALHSFCHANGKYHLMGCILSAASCNKWLNKTVFESDYDVELNDLLTERSEKPKTRNSELATRNLFFLPYLAGERCPHNDEDVRGAFIGLSHSTSREDMQRAVYEGISFAIKDCLALCPDNIRRMAVCGGGTNSSDWMRILCDILNMPLEIIENEGPAYGIAMLAMGKNGNPAVKKTILPNPDNAEIYKSKYEKYRQLYPLLKDFYK